MELLKISLAHKDILEKALSASTVPNDTDAIQFQAIIEHITMPHLLTFLEHDLPMQPSHNRALHIEVLVHNNKVKRVLVDGDVDFNICTLQLIKNLRFSKYVIEKGKGITIRSYDDQE